jgi:hypothetical protein
MAMLGGPNGGSPLPREIAKANGASRTEEAARRADHREQVREARSGRRSILARLLRRRASAD